MKKRITKHSRIAEIKELLTYYKEITETVREPFLILDTNLYVVTANAAFYRKFKVNKRDTEDKRIYDLGNNQWNAPELRELLENILPTHKVLNNYVVTHTFSTIGRKTMLLNARQIDKKQLILLAMEDVTVQLKTRRDSAEMTANLIRQRDKLQSLNDAKDEFISLASHQLRTPATAVKQYLGMLTQGYVGKLTSKQKHMLEVAYRNNERQLELIEDLLRVAKVDAGKVYLEKSARDIIELTEAVIKNQAVLFKNREQEVLFIKPTKEMTAIVDSKLISMALENLLDNAGKYSQKGGLITIRVEQTDEYTTIAVHDHGVGIRKSDVPKLFKRFSRIDNSLSVEAGGNGLGLYWANKVVELHGGRIGIASKINVGSTLTVSLPLTA